MTKASKTKQPVGEKLFREALYAVFNFGYGYENTNAGAQSDEGMELAVKSIFHGVKVTVKEGPMRAGFKKAQKFWNELSSQPDPAGYTRKQIAAGLAGERCE